MIEAILVCASCKNPIRQTATTEEEIKLLQKLINMPIECEECQRSKFWCYDE